MNIQFILIDFENVQPNNLQTLRGREFKVIVFVGATQTKLPTDLACELQTLGSNAQYIRSGGSGRNALDLHIAYHLGRFASAHEGAVFHIISKDTGFDPLIKHLKTQGITCRRWASLGDIPGLKAPSAKATSAMAKVSPGPDIVTRVVDNLAKRGAAKPRTLKTLQSMVKSLMGSQATGEEVARVVSGLERRGVVKILEGKLSYP